MSDTSGDIMRGERESVKILEGWGDWNYFQAVVEFEKLLKRTQSCIAQRSPTSYI